MSAVQYPSDRSAARRRRTTRPRLRLVLLAGAAAVLGGGAWSAATAFGLVGGGTAAGTPDPAVPRVSHAVDTWLALAGETDDAAPVGENLPFGLHDYVDQTMPDITTLLTWPSQRVAAVAAEPQSMASFDARLDDLDGDGDPASDFHDIAGLTADFDADVSARAGGGYDVAVSLEVDAGGDHPLDLSLDGLSIDGGQAADQLDVRLAGAVRVDSAGVVTVPVTDRPLGTVISSLAQSWDDAHKVAFRVGVLGATGTGTVTASGGVAASLVDPNHDGVLDAAELAKPAQVVRLGCAPGSAKVDLTVATDLAGLTGRTGKVLLGDESLCNGLAAPELQLGDLGQFRNLTLGDVVNGLAQVTRSVSSVQTAGDLDLPFVEETLRDLVPLDEKLVKFFVDNGFTDPANPMASIVVDTSAAAKITTVQDLAPRLASALGMTSEQLGLAYADGRLGLKVKTSATSAAKPATLDFGEAFKGIGVTDLKGSGKATLTPSYGLDFGVGIDLAAGRPFDQRFAVTNGAAGGIATIDAPVTADVDVDAVASVIEVTLADAKADGAVPLVQRKDATRPMVSLAVTDPDKDGRTTLAELSAAGAVPVRPTYNVTVPKTDLKATADMVGVPLGAGTVSVSWPTVGATSDAEGFKVAATQDFLDNVLPFTLDTGNPRKLITEILTGTRETVTRIRTAVASGSATTTRPLPLVGRSVADLDPVLQKVQGALDELIQVNDLLTLDQLKAKLKEVIGKALGVSSVRGLDSREAAALSDLVKVRYEKKSGTTPATVLVDLDLGVCSTDHKEGRDCAVTTDPLDLPFNLDLGSASRAGGIAGLGTTGSLQVGYDGLADLTLGVELPTVLPASGFGQLPKVSGSPRIFVKDDVVVELGAGARLDGTLTAGLGSLQVSLGSADQPARAAVAARFRLAKDKPTGQRITLFSNDFSTFLTSLLPKAGTSTVHETTDKLKASCPGITDQVDACAALPVYAEGTSLGSVTFKAPDLLSPSGWSVDSSAVEASIHNEAIQWALLVDGVRTLTEQASQGLRSMPAGTKIPLIGADVTAGADVLDQFDAAVVDKVQAVADTLANDAATAGAAKTKAEELLISVAGLPKDVVPTVALTCRSADGATVAPCAGTEPIGRVQSFEASLPLHYAVDDGTSSFDIGFPGLRLASAGEVRGSAGVDIDLRFGVDRDLGFYVPTAGANPEFRVAATADLPNAPGADMTGDLAFFPVTLEDQGGCARPGQPVCHDVEVSAGLDLTTARADGRLPFAELARLQLVPKLDAAAAVHLGVKTTLPVGASSGLPSFTTDLKVDAAVHWSGAPGSTASTDATIKFDNVAIDIGTVITDFIKPVTKTLRTYTGPLEKPIEAIQKPIPGVKEAAELIGKKAPTWYEAFKAADEAANGKSSQGLQLIDRVISLVNLVKALDASDKPTGQIPIGSFTVASTKAMDPVPLNEADKLVGNSTVAAGGILGKIDFQGKQALQDATTKGGFSFPAFDDPKLFFGMLLGKDVTLARFDAGKLAVQRGFQFSYPLGPARLYIGGSAGVSGHFAAGFDTYGMRKAYELLTDDDTTNDGAWKLTEGLLQSLYVDDFDTAGSDVPEIRFDAELTAGASIGIPGFEVGAEGGVHGTAEFNLKADQTGKLRYTDIARQWKVNKNPLCFFDASAHIDAFIRAFIDFPIVGKATYPIVNARIYDQPNLFDFCKTPQDEHKNLLADLSDDGTLVFRADASPQDITVVQKDATTVEVEAQGLVETYGPVKKMFGDLKGGDDVVDVHFGGENVASPRIPVTFCGGAGNDRLMVSSGKATLYGDSGPGCTAVSSAAAGDDSITAGPADDLLDGGGGSDALWAEGGADTLTGGNDDDVLRGGPGDDALDGGAGTDTTDYGDHSEPVTISLPGPSGSAGEKDNAVAVEAIHGGSANDTITLPATGTTRVDAGAGDDRITAGGGTGFLVGSGGNDTFIGGTGAAQVLGGEGDDVLVDGPGAQTFLGNEGSDTVDYAAAAGPIRVILDGEPGDGPIGRLTATDNIVDTDVVIGGTHDDQLTGGSGDETLRGGPGKDTIEGGPGADTLLGEGGDDDLTGDAGNDHLSGGDGDDRVHGGSGADDLHGDGGYDWADYTDRTEDLYLSKDDAGNDGASLGTEHDNLHTDVERVASGSGDDQIDGWSGLDQLQGNDGWDHLAGHGGTDGLEGGNGNDELYDLSFNQRFCPSADCTVTDDGDDVYDAGEGDDFAYGNGGRDDFELGGGRDHAYGGPGADVLHGGPGDDELRGGGGNDQVDGEVGNDSLWGDDGNDEVTGGDSTGGDTLVGGNGSDNLWNGTGGGVVTTGTGGTTTETDTSANTVHGFGGADNRYNGALGPDTFDLQGGNDIVHASGGNDVVQAGEGDNTVYGDDGNDTITTGSGKDGIYGGAGNDVVTAGAGNDQVTGDAGADTINGAEGDDKLYGNAGDDFIDGGLNADVIEGDDGVDTVSYATRTTPVTIREDGNQTEGGVEDATTKAGDTRTRDYVDWTTEVVIGGAADDAITLRNHNRTAPARIEGRAGDDTLANTASTPVPTTFVGGEGDDVLTGGLGADTFDQGTAPDGADDMRGGAGTDTVDYGHRPAHTAAVSLDDVANDGARGELDNVHADVESALGADTGHEEDPVELSLDPVKVAEGTTGQTTPARFTVRLSAAQASDLTLPWSVTGVTAQAGVDVDATPGTVTVPRGTTSATFDVPVLGDATDEPDETATITVGTAPEAVSATLTILDDDEKVTPPPPVRPVVSIRSASMKEPDKGAKTMKFTIVLAQPTTATVTVGYRTANGTAKAGKDYVARRGVVTFAPGQRTQTVTVKVRGDRRKEKTETFALRLSSVLNGIAGTSGKGTIKNDD